MLGHARVGEAVPVRPYPELFSTLEYLVAALLRRDHPEWRYESIDGFFCAHAVRTGERTLELLGTCVLISDQAVTPFALTIGLHSDGSLDALHVRLGEPGTGQLGISGPTCHSAAADRLLWRLADRVDDVEWVYDLAL